MSGYWDAVARTALGLAGTAVPRPRSIFESDHRRLAAGDAGLLDDTGVTPSVPADMPGAPARDASPVVAAPPNVDPLTSPVGPEIQTDERLEAYSPAASPRGASDARSTEASPTRRDAGAREVRTERVVERVEVQRFETIHTIAEPAPRANQREEPAVPPAAAVAMPATLAADDRREKASTTSGEDTASPTPLVAVAEPSRVISEPAVPVAAHEASPLVIEIDHIDIRIESATPVAPALPRRREREAVPSLDDYLQRRSEGRR